MRKLLKRSLSLLLAFVMVLGLMQTNLTVQAASKVAPLTDADGIIWLAKEGDSVSKAFEKMVTSEFLLDELVREAVGEPESSTAKVYYDGVDIGNVIEIIKNQSTIEGLVDEMKDAITGGQLIEFTVGGKTKYIAFKNIASASITVNGENAIYVSSEAAPAKASDLEGWITKALNSADVVVNDVLTYNGIKFENGGNSGRNIAGYQGSDLKITRNQTMENLVAKWPTIETEDVYQAGTVTLTIYAAEYDRVKTSEQANFKKEVTIPVYLKDSKARGTVTVVAKQPEGAAFVDSEVAGYVATYKGYVGGTVVVEKPSLYNYAFSKWDNGFDGVATVSAEGNTYTAIVAPRVDINKNGVADRNEVYTITYKYANGDVKSYELTYGDPTTPADIITGYVWKTEGGVPWQPYVYGNMTYIQTEIRTTTEVSVKATLLYSGSAFYSDQLVAKMDGEYYLEDELNWETFVPVGYKSSGFYTLARIDDSSVALDMNDDGIKAEYPFVMHNDSICSGGCVCTAIPADKIADVELFYDIYRVNENGEALATATNPLYIYEFERTDGIKITDQFDALSAPTGYKGPEYGESTDPYKYFVGWDFENATDADPSANTFKFAVKPLFKDIVNTVDVSDNIKNVFGEPTSAYVDGKLELTWATGTDDYYKATVEISDMREDGNYLNTEDTEVTVSPIYKYNDIKNTKTIAGYVNELTWSKAGSTAENDIEINYDEDNSAYNTASFAGQEAGESIVLNLNYGYFDLQTKVIEIGAGTSISKADLEKDLVKVRTDFEDLAETPYITEYYARPEVEVKVDLYKLYELFNHEGLGVLLENYGQLPKTHTIKLDEKWQLIEASPEHENSAQEVVDAYLSRVYEELKADKFVNIEEFIGVFFRDLEAELDTYYVHKFGHVDSTAARAIAATELVRVTFSNDEIYATAEEYVTVNDTRKATWFEVNGNVVSDYNNGVNGKLIENVKLVAEDGTEFNVKDLYEDGYIVTKDNDSTREYGIADVGTYSNVVLAFKGNAGYKPSVSAPFSLTVNKVDAKVEVEEMLAVLRGTKYYEDANADVKPFAPYVQIVAGIATDELMLDENLALADNKVVVDAWVKLPQTYVDLLNGLELETLNGFVDGVELPTGTIQAGVYYEKEHLVEELEKYADTKHYGAAQVKQLMDIIDRIPDRVLSRLGVDDLNVTLRIRLDATEKNVYPTAPGFYVNYAATLAKFTAYAGTADKNYAAADDYGFIVISPMVPVPNTGAANVGLQLYDEKLSNVQNVYVYEYDGTNTVRDLEVAFNGATLEGEEPFYYGLTTRFDATKQAPVKPGVYFAGYNYTKMVENKDSGEMEVRRIDSDSAIIIIKQREVDLELKGEIVEYDGKDHIAEIIVTDSKGNVVSDAGVTVISGTVNVDTTGANVSTNDLYGTVNVDFPEGLQDLWDAYCNEKWGKDALDKFALSDVMSFLKECSAAAEASANGAIEDFKSLAINNTVSAALKKINNNQSYVDVSSGNLVNKATRVQHILTGGRVYFDKLIDELEPLTKYDDNVYVTFYDLATEKDKLEYEKTGAYLYVGLVTDPDTTIGAGKALVIIHSADDYIMYDTHVPYNGKSQTIEMDDDTVRSDIKMMVDRDKNEVKFFLDGDVYKAINAVLKTVLGEGEKISDGADGYVATAYTKTKSVGDVVSDKLVEIIKDKAVNRITNKFLGNSDKLDQALNALNTKLDNLTIKIVNKLDEIDKMPNDTRIYVYEMSNEDDLKGMPVNVGTYEFFGYDYDVAATRGKLVIEPIYIEIDDKPASKYEGQNDPDFEATVEYYSRKGVAPASVEQIILTELPDANVFTYEVVRTDGEAVGKYDMSVVAKLLDKSGNYVLVERDEDKQDFEIYPEIGTIVTGIENYIWRMELDSVVQLNFYPTLKDFSPEFDFENRAGVVIWTGEKAPTASAQLEIGKENTVDVPGWIWNEKREAWYMQTLEIYAKDLGENVYIRPYVLDKDGNPVYMKAITYYSPEAFAYGVMNSETSYNGQNITPETKDVCAALLQYGAAAQKYFAENSDYVIKKLITVIPRNYVNVTWDDYKEIVDCEEDVVRDYIDPVVTTHLAELVSTLSGEYNKGIKFNIPTLNLVGAIRLSVGYDITGIEADQIDLEKSEILFWNESDIAEIYANEKSLAYELHNYNYSCPLVKATGEESVDLGDYRGQSGHIIANRLGESVYFACRVVMKDGTVYRGGIGYYSGEQAAADHLNDDESKAKDVSRRILMYSEKMRILFPVD